LLISDGGLGFGGSGNEGKEQIVDCGVSASEKSRVLNDGVSASGENQEC
jgi:hypothetical protein